MDEPKSTSLVVQETTNDTGAADSSRVDLLNDRLQAIRTNPWAFAWCLFAIWVTLLATFDDQASYAILGIPEFRKDFGYYYDGNYVLAASWQSAFNGAPIATRVLGALTAAPVADYIGRRNALIVALAISLVAVTMEFVATTNVVFFVGKLAGGFSVAAMESISGTYLVEIAPLPLRGLMTVLIAFAAAVGNLVVALIINGTGTYTNRWAYRAVFCSQYGFACVAVAFIWFMPESPWWLLSKGREDEALRSLARLGYAGDVKGITDIKLTLERIRGETQGVTYFECFRRSNLRRTLIAIAPLSVQIWSGVIFVSLYSTYYAQLAGYSTSMSFKLFITQQVLSIVGNIMSWFLIDRFGRRTLTVYGTLGLSLVLWTLGGLAVGGTRAELKATVAMILLYTWLYSLTLGSTAYSYLTEVATSRLRAKTVSLGLALQSCFGVMWSFVLPYLFNPDKADLGGKVGFVFAGLAMPCAVLLWLFQPETRGRSYAALDEMFVMRVSARRFAAYRTRSEVEGRGRHGRGVVEERVEIGKG